MSDRAYADNWFNYQTTATMTVTQSEKAARVTYRNEDGARFRVIVRQKDNPIGFLARLPGDPKPT